jgi:molybdopterin-guanine dinucleotide biosynthesis protein A
MPFMKPELIRYIVGRWTDRYEAAVPIFDGKPQPLLGIYSKRLVPKMEKSIKTQKRGLREFLASIEVHYIEEEKVRELDCEGRSFVNINTIQDYERERTAVGG